MKQIGPYRLEGVLGRGGMGTVYSGVHQQTGQRVAVKVLSAADADDGQLRKRFESEIEALIQLKHPNIVEIYAFGDDDEQLYFAMELVELMK